MVLQFKTKDLTLTSTDGRLDSYTLIEHIGGVPTVVTKVLSYDRLGNVTLLGDSGTTANDQTYGYDKLNRLTGFNAPALMEIIGNKGSG